MKNKQTKITMTFDKHGIIDAKFINASSEDIIKASNFLMSHCTKSNHKKNLHALTVTPRRHHKKKTIFHKIYRTFLRTCKWTFEERAHQTEQLLNTAKYY